MMGVADSLARSGTPFCVASQWTFMFEPERACRNVLGWPALSFHSPSEQRPPNSTRLIENARLAVDVVPAESAALPLRIGVTDGLDEKEGFHSPEGKLRWTKAVAHIRFRIAGQPGSPCGFVVRIAGAVCPGRPVEISLNGTPLGNLDRPGETTVEFAVPAGALLVGGDNHLALLVPRAAPIGRDRRELGFGFMGAEIAHASGCPQHPAHAHSEPNCNRLPKSIDSERKPE